MIVHGYAFTDEFLANIDREMEKQRHFFRGEICLHLFFKWRPKRYSKKERVRIINTLVDRYLQLCRKNGMIEWRVDAWHWKRR